MSERPRIAQAWRLLAVAATLICLATPLIAQQSRDELSRMLPPTNLSGDGDTETAPRIAPGFAHASIAHNPLAPEATMLPEQVCTTCHAVENSHFSHSVHALGLRAAAAGNPDAPVCAACHGAGSAHITDPWNKQLIISFTRTDDGASAEVRTGVCLTCHEGGPRDHWTGSVHQRNGVTCSDCHNPMSQAPGEGLLVKNSINETCAQCHRDVRAQFDRRSHMPLPEGQISCADCHNPHGSLTAPLLKTNTVNETCFQCHAEKRGPHLFEHAPVRGNCLNCHTPHGSNQASLLNAPIPFLCQQCHTNLRHPNDLQTAQSLGTGGHPDERLMGRGCLTCHAQIHGSNNPSGPRLHK